MVEAGATSPGTREKQLDAQIKSADMVSLDRMQVLGSRGLTLNNRQRSCHRRSLKWVSGRNSDPMHTWLGKWTNDCKTAQEAMAKFTIEKVATKPESHLATTSHHFSSNHTLPRPKGFEMRLADIH